MEDNWLIILMLLGSWSAPTSSRQHARQHVHDVATRRSIDRFTLFNISVSSECFVNLDKPCLFFFLSDGRMPGWQTHLIMLIVVSLFVCYCHKSVGLAVCKRNFGFSPWHCIVLNLSINKFADSKLLYSIKLMNIVCYDINLLQTLGHVQTITAGGEVVHTYPALRR